MKILPTLAEVREIASDVNYNVLPVIAHKEACRSAAKYFPISQPPSKS